MRAARALLAWTALTAFACGHVEVPAGTVERASELCQARSPSLPARAFSTDGCSAWPDGSWQTCCIEHDIVYWCGGSEAERAAADRALQHCVGAQRSDALAWLMWAGVRMGGHPALPLPWRWGYGRPWPGHYVDASKAESKETSQEACGESE